MNETEFIKLTDAIFNGIEDHLEMLNADIDVESHGNVLDIAFDNNEHIVINRNIMLNELWLAAQRQGYHFTYQHGEWISTREKLDFFSVLSDLVYQLCGESILFKEEG